MPAATFTLDDSLRAVERILAGRSLDDTQDLGVHIPFTDRADVRLAAAMDIHAVVLCSNLADRYMQPLIVKMLHHYATSGWQSVAVLDEMRTLRMLLSLIDALEKEPTLLDTDADIPALIRKQGR